MWGVETVLEFIEEVFFWVLCQAWTMACPIVLWCVDFLPPTPPALLANAVQCLNMAQYWVGLGDVFLMVGFYWVFASVFAGIKILVKLIPTVG